MKALLAAITLNQAEFDGVTVHSGGNCNAYPGLSSSATLSWIFTPSFNAIGQLRKFCIEYRKVKESGVCFGFIFLLRSLFQTTSPRYLHIWIPLHIRQVLHAVWSKWDGKKIRRRYPIYRQLSFARHGCSCRCCRLSNVSTAKILAKPRVFGIMTTVKPYGQFVLTNIPILDTVDKLWIHKYAYGECSSIFVKTNVYFWFVVTKHLIYKTCVENITTHIERPVFYVSFFLSSWSVNNWHDFYRPPEKWKGK